MYRVDRETLRVELGLRIWKAFKNNRHGLKSDLGRRNAELAIEEDLLNFFDGPGVCVVRADTIGQMSQRQVFGQDVPWPAPLEMERHAHPPKG